MSNNSEYVINFTKNRKNNLIQIFGSKCCLCGFNKWQEALEFHHVNPEEKEFGLSSNVMKSVDKQISEARKSKEHEDMDMDEFIKCILHEFVHSCQQEWNSNSNGTSWYWEALATNLSKQDYSSVSLEDCDFEKLKSDFNGTKDGYNFAYTLGKYMLENYSKEKFVNVNIKV